MTTTAMECRREARLLLAQLTEFTTAAHALETLFGADKGVLRQVLSWQAPAQALRALPAVVAAFASDAEEAEEPEGRLLLAMGKPALLFATSLYDEDLALLVWRGLVRCGLMHVDDLARQALDTSFDSHGFCALHYAVEAQMPTLLAQVTHDLLPHATRVARFSLRAVTQDVVLPVGKSQVHGRNIASGGCSLLHLAARKGELELAQLLVAPPFSLRDALTTGDWDGSTPLRLARLHDRDDVAAFLLVRRCQAGARLHG